MGDPLLSGAYGDPAQAVAPAAPSGGGRIAWIAAIAAAIALLVGGGAFAFGALGAQDGAATPEEAVDQLVAAINDEDLIALGEILHPGERRTLTDPVLSDMVPELVRLGALDESFDAAGISGLDLELADVEYRVDPIAGHDDIRHVWFTGGTGAASLDADRLPVGPAIRTRFGDRMEDSSEGPEPFDTTDPTPLVVVERDGRWFVSLWFSVAETIRMETDADLPAASAAPTPLGADSPEAAVDAMITELVEFDLEGLIGRMDPEEMAAIYRYSPLFLDDAQSVLADARSGLRDEGVTWNITGVELDSDTDGDDAIVRLRALTLRVAGDGFDVEISYGPDRIEVRGDVEIDGERGTGSLVVEPDGVTVELSAADFSFRADVVIDRDASRISLEGAFNGDGFSGELDLDRTGSCSRYSFEGLEQSEQGCVEDLELVPADQDVVGSMVTWLDELGTEFPAMEMAAHRVDGEWYVSPIGTMMHGAVAGLRSMEQATFDDMLDSILDAEQTLSGGFDPEALVGDLMGPLTDGGFVVDDGGTITIDDVPIDPPVVDDVNFLLHDADLGATTATAGTLDAGARHLYSVDVPPGAIVGVTLYGSDLVPGGLDDPVLSVVGPDGFDVAYNDDFDGLNSGLQLMSLEPGRYQIVVSDLGFGGGDYELTVQIEDESTDPELVIGWQDDFSFDGFDAELEDLTALDVAAGQTVVVEGEVASFGFDRWTIDLAAGDTILVTLEAADEFGLDPNLIVYGAGGDEVATNDDADPSAGLAFLDSQLEYTATTAGEYAIETASLGYFGEGGYVLTVERR